ncbi:MAG: hypothetical protein WC891_06360 [Actinomycetota bacterium]
MTKPLPAEIASLIHHIELNKTNWWEKVIQQFIVATLWAASDPLSTEEILVSLQKEFSIEIDNIRMERQLIGLLKESKIVQLPDGKYKISEDGLRELNLAIEDSEKNEETVKSLFTDAVKKCCPKLDLEDTWRHFSEDMLIPLVQEMGAHIYDLIADVGAGIEDKVGRLMTFQGFLNRFDAETRPQLRNAIISFLDPKNSSIRVYLLRLLNAYFFLESTNLKSSALDELQRLETQSPKFILFLDTNFIFSALGIHENPSNEAARLLMDLVSKLSGKVDIQLRVLPPTLDETRGVLTSYSDYLGGLRMTGSLANAASSGNLSGLALKYVEEAKKAKSGFDAQSYFNPYIKGLQKILSDKGIELYNADLSKYGTDQTVVDDIMRALEEQDEKGTPRKKTYEQFAHDFTLWHFVKDIRPARTESPIDAEFWIVTVDYRFINYDKKRQLSQSGNMPICLSPVSLMQMLQFWIPRTPEFEEAIVSSLRLPFLFHGFDTDAERATIRILKTLSRYENIDGLSETTLSGILMNEALQGKMLKSGDDEEKQAQLVHAAIIDENKAAQKALEIEKQKAKSVALKSAKKDQQIKDLISVIEEKDRAMQVTSSNATAGVRAIEKLEEEIKTLGDELARVREQEAIKNFIVAWVFKAVLGSVVPALLGAYMVVMRTHKWAFFLPSLLSFAFVISIAIVSKVEKSGSRDEILKDTSLMASFREKKKTIFIPLVVGTIASIGAWIVIALFTKASNG